MFERRPSKQQEAQRAAKKREERRAIIATGIATGASLLWGVGISQRRPRRIEDVSAEATELPPVERLRADDAREEEGPARTYATGPLEGRAVADLFAFYLGVPEGTVIGPELLINFRQVLSDLWTKKMQFVERREPEWLDNTRRGRHVFLEAYREASESNSAPTDLLSLNRSLKPVVAQIHEAVDWSRLKEDPQLNMRDEDMDLVRDLAGEITSEMLLAYSITELMPAVNNAEMNVDMTDFLIKNAGPQFLASIPAIHDPYLSAGAFQFTSHALYRGADGVRGASIINQYVAQEARIPDSVIRLTSMENQTRAAYLFAVENLMRLVKVIRRSGNRADRRIATLRTHSNELRVGLLQYIAGAHHNPSQARRGFIAWMDQNFVGKHSIHCGEPVRTYVRKSNKNYTELMERVRRG